MEDFLVPIFICVVLPVAIVWLVARTKQNETNRKAEIMLKAIEAGTPVDLDMFKSDAKVSKTIKQDLLEFIETNLLDCPCKFMVLQHSLHVQVLHTNQVIQG